MVSSVSCHLETPPVLAENLHSREGTRSLVTTLVDITSSSIISPQHGHDTVRVPVGSGNVRPLGSNVVNVESDPTGRLRNHGTRLERVVDAVDRVVLHGDQEARRELRVRGTGVEELRIAKVSLSITPYLYRPRHVCLQWGKRG
jgi:hypothetical protein